MKKLIIDRKKWNRGSDIAFGRKELLNEQGNMCCLGFDALNEGLSKGEIECRTYPENTNRRIKGICYYRYSTFFNTKVASNLAKINDDILISEEEREEKITKLFAKIGRKVEFIN